LEDEDKVQFFNFNKVINLHHMFTIGMDVICTNKTYNYIIDVCSTGYLSCYNEIFLMLNFKPYLVAQHLLPLTHTGPYSTEQSKLTDNNNDSTEPAFVFSEKEVKKIIFGSLLGDGSLEKSLKSKNARFKFSQTIKAKDYFLQLYSIFKPFFTPNYSFANYNYLDKRTDNSYTTLSFTTRALPLCPSYGRQEFYSQFYFNNIKQAPDSLILLTPLALAH
jgi:LAGLIDADG DNA endonuclease family